MKGLRPITKPGKNMKQGQRLTLEQKYHIRHRGLIETVFDILKHIFDIEHSRNSNTKNYFANVLGAVIAYTFWDRPPKHPGPSTKNGTTGF